jgi:glycerophosphoryl diester phosphodiesterase
MGEHKLVIAHRGASGYLPEHTAEAKALAHAMGADYIEQDVVITRDGVPVVLHDVTLDTVTDVAKVFPDRHRDDGRYYVIDFTLEEIERLKVTERINLKTGKAVFPHRFPIWSGDFRIATLADELALIAGLNHSTGRTAGVYAEVKSPAWHRQQGSDCSRIVVETLAKAGYRGLDAAAFIQCFDFKELRRIREELGCDLPLVQLIGDGASGDAPDGYDELCSPAGLQTLAGFAQGIGPSMSRVLHFDGGKSTVAELTHLAHDAGLVVHPYTLRKDSLPKGVSADALCEALFVDANVDGAFTDFPDHTGQWLRTRN